MGIASLTEGVTDLANSSRKLEERELQRAREFSGQEPVEFVVALDALAVYVHLDNPLDTITIEQLAEIYGEGGATTRWSQLGVNVPGCESGDIIRVSRQNNSGTYHYFREAVLGPQRDYRLGSTDLSGSKDVVALVSSTPCSIGYSGMGYRTDNVKSLKIAATAGLRGRWSECRDGQGRKLPHRSAALESIRWGSPKERSRTTWIGCDRPRASKWCSNWATFPFPARVKT